MSDAKLQIRPERFSFKALDTEQRVSCNGHRIEYYDHIDHRRYHLHSISLFPHGSNRTIFSFELENEEFDKFLLALIKKNPELACTLLQSVVQDKVDVESKLLMQKALAINEQLLNMQKGKYI